MIFFKPEIPQINNTLENKSFNFSNLTLKIVETETDLLNQDFFLLSFDLVSKIFIFILIILILFTLLYFIPKILYKRKFKLYKNFFMIIFIFLLFVCIDFIGYQISFVYYLKYMSILIFLLIQQIINALCVLNIYLYVYLPYKKSWSGLYDKIKKKFFK